MWTRAQLAEDLCNIGIETGSAVLVHASLRAVGAIDGGADTLIAAIQDTLGPDGTLIVPCFTYEFMDLAEGRFPPQTPESVDAAQSTSATFNPAKTPCDIASIGAFAEAVRLHPDAHRSDHPVVSFAAIGRHAAFLTHNAPFHYPLGSESPLARLHRIDGRILLVGVGHTANSSVHLAEVWADVPYIHRNARVKAAGGEWTTMEGSPECSAGFEKIEPLLSQGRILRRGYIGSAISQRMSQRAVVSMAIAMLQGEGSALLCDAPDCKWCILARKHTSQPR
jgi:aminoglycoside 3-N-acetyltransferase